MCRMRRSGLAEMHFWFRSYRPTAVLAGAACLGPTSHRIDDPLDRILIQLAEPLKVP